jgi:hypothetical protein
MTENYWIWILLIMTQIVQLIKNIINDTELQKLRSRLDKLEGGKDVN